MPSRLLGVLLVSVVQQGLRRKWQQKNRRRRRRNQEENSDPQVASSQLLLSSRAPAQSRTFFMYNQFSFTYTHFYLACFLYYTESNSIHFHHLIFNLGSFLPKDACKSDGSRQELSNEHLPFGRKNRLRYSRERVPESFQKGSLDS